MSTPIHFHADLYSREALERAASRYEGKARLHLTDLGSHIVVHLEAPSGKEAPPALRDAFCNDAFAVTVRALHQAATDGPPPQQRLPTGESAAPWALIDPFSAGSTLGMGWVLDSLSPVRGGAATLVLRHERKGVARVAIRRNNGRPRGVAHTEHLDFMLLNAGSGATQTEESIERVLVAFAESLPKQHNGTHSELLAPLLPFAERPADGRADVAGGAGSTRRATPRIDSEQGIVCFDLDEAGISRLDVYDTLLTFTDRCSVFLTRTAPGRIGLQLTPCGDGDTDSLRVLVRDVTKALNRVLHPLPSDLATPAPKRLAGLSPLPRPSIDLDALLTTLDDADPATVGVGFQPDRGPNHEGLRVLNILGTSACDSDCVFCCEKFSTGMRAQPNADATCQLILDGAHQFDLLFFANGEPTINPNLLAYVELARSVGFTAFGMSSHFRGMCDPHFSLKILQGGFQYFDISLHAADAASQLAVNPIGDAGASLREALKGLAVLYQLAHALGIRISVTHKIVVSRLNVTQLEAIFRATYERGVRHFILQPVRTLGLTPERQVMLSISEDEMLPHINEFLHRTAGLGAAVKPYGFSRRSLLSFDHVEHERNRVKNVSGRPRTPGTMIPPSTAQAAPPTDGSHRIELRSATDQRFAFAADNNGVILDQALQHGVELPFGCRMGSCGMCCARLLEGRVDQSGQIFLTDEQVAQGYVLLCQARPLSNATFRMCSDEQIDRL
jgi:ferredoxin